MKESFSHKFLIAFDTPKSMKKIDIKELKEDSLEISREMCQYAFFPTPVDELQTREPQYQKETYVAALFEQDVPMATAACLPLTQNIRGKIFKSGGIADVATYPEGRRKGYAKQLLHHMLLKMKEQEQVFSCLYPFNETFYEKFGYVTLPQIKIANFSPNVLMPLLSLKIDGIVERHLLKENFEAYLEVINEMQKKIHGFAIKPESSLQQTKDKYNAWLAIAKKDEKITGCFIYNVTKPFETLKIIKFLYEDSNAKYLLLQYLAKHVNQFKEIEIELRPDELVECWVADSVATVKSRPFAAISMGRVISVENISGMDVGTGTISAKITDSNCSWNNNSYEFSSENGKLTVNKTENYECKLTIQGLSALIFGGYDPHDFIFRKWSNASSDVADKMERLFPRILPYLHSGF